MVKMKYAIVLVAAALSVASQAHAVGGSREVRSEAEIKAERDRTARESGIAVGGHSRDAISATATSVKDSGLINSPTVMKKFTEAISQDGTLQKLANEAIDAQKSDASVRPLAAAQLEGLANLQGIDRGQTAQTIANLDPRVRADQSYYTLVTSVAPAARSWKGQSRDVSTSLLVKANAHIKAGKSAGEALLLAKGEVESEINSRKEAGKADYKINLDDIFKFCKTI